MVKCPGAIGLDGLPWIMITLQYSWEEDRWLARLIDIIFNSDQALNVICNEINNKSVLVGHFNSSKTEWSRHTFGMMEMLSTGW